MATEKRGLPKSTCIRRLKTGSTFAASAGRTRAKKLYASGGHFEHESYAHGHPVLGNLAFIHKHLLFRDPGAFDIANGLYQPS